MGGGGCCIGDCCIGNLPCCVLDTPRWCIGDFLGCGDGGGCGYHPGPSKDEIHAKKIADELAQMKENMRKSTEKIEKELIDYINSSINELIQELKVINSKLYGGKPLNLNIEDIKQKNEDLKNEVIGSIGDYMDIRLVQTDKELSVILAEMDDEKRGKNFEDFCEKVRKKAIVNLKKKIEVTINKQSEVIHKEIEARLKEVEINMQKSLNAYQDIINLKNTDSPQLESAKMQYIYELELCSLLLDETQN